jgi:hypothetical protein
LDTTAGSSERSGAWAAIRISRFAPAGIAALRVEKHPRIV